MKKVLIRTKKEARELAARLRLKDFTPSWDDIPGVWVVHYPELPEEEGYIGAKVSFLDFYPQEEYAKSEQLLLTLNGDHWNDQIPYNEYPTVEKYLRTAVILKNHIGNTFNELEKDCRNAEADYRYFVQTFALQYMKENDSDKITVAKIHAENKAREYLDKWNEVKFLRDRTKTLRDSLSDTLRAFSTIASKLKEEYLKFMVRPQGNPEDRR